MDSCLLALMPSREEGLAGIEDDWAVVEVPLVAGAARLSLEGSPPPPVDGVLAGVWNDGVSLDACDTGLDGAWHV